MIRGIDVSAFQPATINWPQVKADGFDFVIVKVSEGNGYASPVAAAQAAGARAAGLAVSYYHYCLPGVSPEAQAAFFWANLPPLDSGTSIWLDCEEGAGDLSPLLLRALRTLEGLAGFRPGVYSFLDFVRMHLHGSSLAAYPLWLAAYISDPTLLDHADPSALWAQMPACPAPWRTYALWQCTSSGRSSGIAGAIDISAMAGSLDDFTAFGKPAPVAPSPAPTPKPKTVTAWKVTTAQYLRAAPDTGSARLAYAPVGAILPVAGAPTPHWAHVRDGEMTGWLLQSNGQSLPAA